MPKKKVNRMRLNKFLAHAGIASRRKCDELIEAGHISVNGEQITRLGVVIDEHKDKVTYKSEPVHLKSAHTYVVLNKPQGVVTTANDQYARQTVVDLIGIVDRIYPVGRLDYDTSGTLILTDDGELTNTLIHPNFKVTKVYHALLDKVIRPVDLHKLRQGVMLDDKKTIPCKIREIRIINNCSFLEIELQEGRNRQIRRMFELFDYIVEKLERISFAGITCKGLQPGEWRYLKAQEIAALKERI